MEIAKDTVSDRTCDSMNACRCFRGKLLGTLTLTDGSAEKWFENDDRSEEMDCSEVGSMLSKISQ